MSVRIGNNFVLFFPFLFFTSRHRRTWKTFRVFSDYSLASTKYRGKRMLVLRAFEGVWAVNRGLRVLMALLRRAPTTVGCMYK